MLLLVPSSINTTQHPTENIMIHSIQTAPEETVLIRTASGEVANESWENIPQQLHVSRLPSGSLSLGPGQVAIVPVTFLPRYPDMAHDNVFFLGEAKPPPLVSAGLRADIVDVVGEDILASFEKQRQFYDPGSTLPRRRSNLDTSSLPAGDEFEVTTSIVVDTSRGVLQMPISASSVRQNPYSIPDVIRFVHSKPPESNAKAASTKSSSGSLSTSPGSESVILLNSVQLSHEEDGKVSSKARPFRKADPARDCFDLYVNNPSAESDLEISEVLVSRPDLMSVEFDPARLLLAPDLQVLPSQPSQVVRAWTEEGPMYIPPDSVDNYIATVCTAPNGVGEDYLVGAYLDEMSNWIDSGNPDQSLGFLQIRTDVETLFISLERFIDKASTNPPAQIATAATDESALETVTSTKISSSLLKATPESFEFRMLSSASPPISANITLQNKSPVPIRIMRMTVTVGGKSDRKGAEAWKRLGLQITVNQGEGSVGGTLPAARTVENAFVLTCQSGVNPASIPLDDGPFHFHGALVLRGTMDTELTYDEWREEIKRDPYREIHLTLELPYVISVLNGRLEVTLERSTHPYPQIFGAQPWDRSGRAVSTLFFPLDRFDAVEDSEAPLPTQKYSNSREIGHDLRVMTNMDLHLNLEAANIVDQNGMPVEGTHSLCARFNVSQARAFETSNTYQDFQDLGFLALQYRFDLGKERNRKSSGREDWEDVVPTTCYLNIQTSPSDTAVHRIPLVVFPAQLEITSPSRSGGRHTGGARGTEMETSGRGKLHDAVEVGYNRLLDWFRLSAAGQSFLESLESMSDKKNLRDSQLLKYYIRKLLRLPEDSALSNVKPILLKIGAIEHGQISKVPLVFTNHNPIPLTLTIDVGEVEGMTIELGKDASHGRGDGNNLLDYLPKVDSLHSKPREAVVTEGSLRGHPVYGLRQFLLSNPRALEFFSMRMRYRDAISLNKAAVEEFPFLQDLYQWHSYAHFHADDIVEVASTNISGTCDVSGLPSDYQPADPMYRTPGQNSLPGPFMVSGDKKLVRHLQVCADGQGTVSSGRKVLIPPGGSARFEVKLRSPPETILDNDISQLLATGLVLSTNFGQKLPIFATFEALQGQLHFTRAEEASQLTSDGRTRDSIAVSVPLELDWHSTANQGYEASSSSHIVGTGTDFDAEHSVRGISLHINSSFSRRVRLLDIESCNPWFHVALQNSSDGIHVDMNVATEIGSVRGFASCLPDEGYSSAYPSFYQCALNWLLKRHVLQPPGCGEVPKYSKKNERGSNALDVSQKGVRGVILAFEAAKIETAEMFASPDIPRASEPNSTAIDRAFFYQPRGTAAIKSGRTKSDGYIGWASLRTHAEAWDAWRVADQLGLTRITSNLRATIEFDPATSEPGEKEVSRHQSLSLSMQDLGVQSSLVLPRLVASQESYDSSTSHDISSVRFPPTLVGSVSSMKIPLRNPTSVPVRVRLAAATPASEADQKNSQDSLKDRFLASLDAPYVQGGSGLPAETDASHHLWWDGGGSFFLVDEAGDVIRSHHNISIKAGAGAHVSLINPSLNSISAFLLGCGPRCGVRDDAKVSENSVDLKHFSTIGASAAASTTLVGRKRSSHSQLNEINGDAPFIYAGGTPLPRTSGPLPFAIPFSSLDEVVIPPYGTAEVGPILFRPPGRYLALGCDLVRYSDATYWGHKVGELCETEMFSSMVLLENSLTGIERIQLKGKSLWEHLYFIDPAPTGNDDAFGDIEMRNGRSTLVFGGTGKAVKGMGWRVNPVVKRVFLHNGGDAIVAVTSVYLSDTNKILEKSWPRRTSGEACRSGSFRILDCWESERRIFNVNGDLVENVHASFILSPGESRLIYVEFVADCSVSQEFVSLNVEFVGANQLSEGDWKSDTQLSFYNGDSAKGSSRRLGRLRTKKIDLVLGYSMDASSFAECKPVNVWNADVIVVESAANSTRTRKLARGRSTASEWWLGALASIARFSVFGLLVIQAYELIIYLLQNRRQMKERAVTKARGSVREEIKSGSEKKRPSQQSLWNATFRCLARADPTSLELQALGREQIRQVVAGRYRVKGGSPPLSLANYGAFVRERQVTAAAPGGISRQRTGKEGGGGERVRTLSDALFRTFSSEQGDSARSLLPAGLGWRVAYARGIIGDKSIEASRAGRATILLMERRSNIRESDHSQENEDDHLSDDTQPNETADNADSAMQSNVQDAERSIPKNDVPELQVSDERSIRTEESAEDAASSSEKWTRKHSKKTEKSQEDSHKEPSKEQAASHANNGQNLPPKEPPVDLESPTSPTVSIRSESSSTKGGAKARKSGNKSEPQMLSSRRGDTGITRPQKEPTGVQKKQKGKNLVKDIGKPAGESPTKDKDSPVVSRNKRDTWGEKTKPKSKAKKATPKVKTTQGIGSSKDVGDGNTKGAKYGDGPTTSAMLPPGMSPPPGLAPPPGFNQGMPGALDSSAADVSLPMRPGGIESASLGDMLTAALQSDLNLSGGDASQSLNFSQHVSTARSDLLFGGLGDTSAVVTPVADGGDFGFRTNPSPTIGGIPASTETKNPDNHNDHPAPSGDPLLHVLLNEVDNSRNGFDVMDFLDSILDDGGGGEHEGEQGLATPGSFPGSSDAPVSLNPWASSEKKSRATAYGIAFDDSEEVPGFNSHGSGGDASLGPIPLLTPAAILMDFQDDGDDEDDRAFSFYARLTDED